MLWFCIHIVIIVSDGISDNLYSVDVGVVLGNKVEVTGKPSKRLQSRLDRAVELYKKGYFKQVIVSGGIGKEGFDEAKVMKNYMVQSGVPEKSIILDNKGNNTFMTAENSKLIMDEIGFNSVMVISQYYHITRTKLAFEKVGIDKVYTAHAKIFEIRDLYSLTREFFAYYKYLVM
ncbi:MAG: YdcF family protein [Firmicutes bacterium]|nr:YdcF family protein [Bacillota bacterium]